MDETAQAVEKPAITESGEIGQAGAPPAMGEVSATGSSNASLAESTDAERPNPEPTPSITTPPSVADGLSSALDEVSSALGTAAGTNGARDDFQPIDLPELRAGRTSDIDAQRVAMLHDVNLRVRIELGRTQMLVEEVLKLGEGSVVELDKLAGDPVDVYVNDRFIARGEVLVLNDNFCVRINEILSNDPHRVPM